MVLHPVRVTFSIKAQFACCSFIFSVVVLQVNVGRGSHPSLVKVFGPGVEDGLKANEPTHFTVDCSGAGDGTAAELVTLPTLMMGLPLIGYLIMNTKVKL